MGIFFFLQISQFGLKLEIDPNSECVHRAKGRIASAEIFVVVTEWHKEVKVKTIQLLLSDMGNG